MDPGSASSCQYQYSPLPSSTSIRLLELQASSANEISLTMHASEIDTALPFDALSYTWGNPRSPYIESPSSERHAFGIASFPATCNGLTLMIRPNLRDALRMLQTTSFSSLGRSKQRYIWIDAICINQANLKERASQVALMASLYQRAESVIAWLGPEDETTADAFAVMDRLSSISFIPKSASELHITSEAYSIVTAADFLNPVSYRSKLGIDPLTPENWLAWLIFIHRPYFKRAWVVQEVTLAKSIIAICGTRSFDWQKLSIALYFLAHTKWFSKLHPEYFRMNVVHNAPAMYSKILAQSLDPGIGAMYLNQTRNGTNLAGKFYKFEMLLKNHRYCEASDSRDIIYALLGISQKESKPFTTHGHLLMPDYTIPVETLYTRIARILIQSYGDLRFLPHREGRRWRYISGLPSWVPDYSAKLLPDPFALRGPNCNWCASGSLEWKIDNRHYDDPLLDVQGIFVGKVSARSDDPSGNKDWDGLWTSACKVAQGLYLYYGLAVDSVIASSPTNPDRIQTHPTRIEAFWRTLVADTFLGQYPAPEECGEQFLTHASAMVMRIMAQYRNNKSSLKARATGRMHTLMYRIFGRSIKENKAGPWVKLFHSEPKASRYSGESLVRKMGELTARSNDKSVQSYEEWSRPMADFRREVDLTLGTRRLFRTDGGLLGMGPLETEMGDEVWILAGAKTPVVLRDGSPGKKQLLGEAYIHGLMHGEILDAGLDIVGVILE